MTDIDELIKRLNLNWAQTHINDDCIDDITETITTLKQLKRERDESIELLEYTLQCIKPFPREITDTRVLKHEAMINKARKLIGDKNES